MSARFFARVENQLAVGITGEARPVQLEVLRED